MIFARRLAAALCFSLAIAAPVRAARVDLPLQVPLETVRAALLERLSASGTAGGDLFREGPCRFLALDDPRLEGAAGALRLSGPGRGRLGVELGGQCQNALDWRGTIELRLAPRIDADGVLRVRVLDSKLVDEAGTSAGVLWELAKAPVHERIEQLGVDLGASREALASMLRGIVPPEQSAAVERALKGLEVRQPRVEASRIVVPVALELPDAWLVAPAPRASAAPLSDAEMEALEKSLEPFDAFLVYAIRHAALESEDGAFRGRLFTLLLDTRYRLVALLGGDPAVGGDPVRELFLDAWGGLRGVLSEAQASGLLAKSVLRYALFVDAGDALLALEQAAPGLPLSADGLRRLARTLAPAEASDPLAHGWAVDPELARLFGFQPIPEKGSSLPFFVRTAEGERPLDRWVPARSELGEYEKRLGALLRSTAAAEEARAELAAPYDAIYESLVPATALIESCWHQYVARGGKVTYLRSAAGSIGLMQINQHVWRGFYDVNRLRWDTAYNARAGAQILLRYVKDYAIPYAEKAGDPRRVPRAAYAVYNAGPRAAGRFDRPKPHPREARVDEKLWTLFQGLAAGGEADLETCGVRPARAAAAARS